MYSDALLKNDLEICSKIIFSIERLFFLIASSLSLELLNEQAESGRARASDPEVEAEVLFLRSISDTTPTLGAGGAGSSLEERKLALIFAELEIKLVLLL